MAYRIGNETPLLHVFLPIIVSDSSQYDVDYTLSGLGLDTFLHPASDAAAILRCIEEIHMR